jgi:dihydrofolate reductase
MQPLRYAINVTLDGCCDHRAGEANEEGHIHATANIARASALLMGRVTYELMERAFRHTDPRPDWMTEWMMPFAKTIDAAKKFVVSSTLPKVDWNAEFLRGDLAAEVTRLKQQPGNGLLACGVTLPLALAKLGLIDEYEFIVQPRLAGHGPTLMAGLAKYVDLRLVDKKEFRSGAVALRYVVDARPSTR